MLTAKQNDKKTSRALRILDELDANIAVLDHNGIIIETNQTWKDFAEKNPIVEGAPPHNVNEGTNYLDICLKAEGPSCEGALLVYKGIRAVLNGKLKYFSHEYPCHSPEKQRWFSIKVKPLRESKPKEVVVIHEDITDRILAEIAFQTRQHQLTEALTQLQTLAGEIKNSISYQLPISLTENTDIQTPRDKELLEKLSKREIEVLKGLIRGERTASMATRLGINIKSVSTYRSRILRKLKLDNNAELVAFTSRIGFL